MSFFKNEKRDLREILRRIRRRDFSGDAGKAVRNSSYQLATNIIVKIGSLLFTVILARILLPEAFGLYSLALSTIILFFAFTDLGIGQALMTFLPKKFNEKNYQKANGYIYQLLKWKLFLILIISLALIVLGYFFSNFYYNKPIYLALLAGVFYILFSGLFSFYEQIYRAKNDFKIPFKKELIFQLLRLIIVPLVVLALIGGRYDTAVSAAIIFSISICYLIGLIYLLLNLGKNFPRVPKKLLDKKEKQKLIKFILPLIILVFSGIFFGSIDMIILGGYVSAEFISYYGVAFALIGSATGIIGFSSSSLFPIFASSKGKKLERFFGKAKFFILMISLLGAVGIYLFAKVLILLIYGSDYFPALQILKLFSILVILIPISGLYDSYLISQKKTKSLAVIVIFITILNIILNFIGIKYGLSYGPMGAIMGLAIATILSKVVYLVSVIGYKSYLLKN
jgi:O-antigen/teichoic acid export membrane protein